MTEFEAETQIVSINTDGLLIRVAPGDEEAVAAVIGEWEQATGFEMEQKKVKAYRRLNVNAYIAVGEDGSIKSKGLLNFQPGLDGDPNETVVAEAVAMFMRDGVPVRETIEAAAAEKNLFKFARVLTSNGPGFTQGEARFGNVVRVYRSNASGLEPIVALAHGKVGDIRKAEGSRIFASLSVWPDDIDIESYIASAAAIIEETSVEIDNRRNLVAREIEARGLATVGEGGSSGIRTGGNFSGSRLICVKLGGGDRITFLPPGVAGEETLLLKVARDGAAVGEIHRLGSLPAKEARRLKEIDGAAVSGHVPVWGEGYKFEALAGVAEGAPENDPGGSLAEAVRPAQITAEGLTGGATVGEIELEDNDVFIEAIFGDDAAEAYVVSMVEPPDSDRANWSGGPVRFARGRHNAHGWNNFVCISTFEPEETGGYFRRAQNFKAMHCLMLDDIGTKAEDPAAIGFGPPTAKIETSPGNFQLIYALTEPVTNAAFAEAIINAAIKNDRLSIGDKGSGDLTRVFRLPVGTNNKAKYPAPFRHRLVEWRPGVRYTPAEILGWLGEDAEVVNARAEAAQPRAGSAASDIAMEHPVISAFREAGKLIGEAPRRGGWIEVQCPWSDNHSAGREDDGAAIQISGDGTWRFKCHHGHCQGEKIIMRGGQEMRVRERGSFGVRQWFFERGSVLPRHNERIWSDVFDTPRLEMREGGLSPGKEEINMSCFTVDEASGVTPVSDGDGATSGANPRKPQQKHLFDPWTEQIAPEFPRHVLPSPIADFVEAKGQETGACRSAITMSALTAASAALSHETTLSLNEHGQFQVRPRIWTLLVGDPSQKKTPAQMGAVKVLEDLEAREWAERLRQWESIPEEERPDEPPPRPHFVVTDTTPEALAQVLEHQPRGLLVHADEMSGFIGSMDRYTSGKGSSATRAMWLKAYDGGRYSLLRVARKTVPVPNLSVSILGGIQPERLREMEGLQSDGLLQRFIPVMMRRARMSARSFDPRPYAAWQSICTSLVDTPAAEYTLSVEAREVRWELEEKLYRLMVDISEGTAWQSFLGKQLGVWGSLTLLLHHLHGFRGATEVAARTARMAAAIVEDFILPHGLCFYGSIRGRGDNDLKAIGAFIATFPDTVIRRRDLARGPTCCRGLSGDEITRKVEPFVLGGWLEPPQSWPPPGEWIVTPGLAEMFSKGVEAQRELAAEVRSKIQSRGGALNEG
jgi:hypothetical protein